MTQIPQYLTRYPQQSSFPFHLTVHTIAEHYPAHRHDFLEFSLVIEGRGAEKINGRAHPMNPGTFTFVLPYQIHELRAEPGHPLKLYNGNFGMELLLGQRADWGISRMILTPDERLPAHVQWEGEEFAAMRRLFAEMVAEYRSDGEWKQALLCAKLTETLIRFDRKRRLRAASAPVPERAPASRQGTQWWKILHYIHTHYWDELTLAGVANAFGLNMTYLSEMFPKQVGLHFSDFLHEVRLRHACSLLDSSDMSVSAIAMEVGFGSYRTFARVFRERKGLTPTEYRNRPDAR
jgi:AraC-like DNA-binding protein